MSHPFDKLAALRGNLPAGPADPPASAPVAPAHPLAGKIVVRHERKGRGGKTVTVVQGVALADEALETWARDLKKALGCGATVEPEGRITPQDLGIWSDAHAQALVPVASFIVRPRAMEEPPFSCSRRK